MAEATSTSVESVEQWKPVLGTSGDYEVSDQGRVRSMLTSCSVVRRYRPSPRVLSPEHTRTRYLRVCMSVSPGVRRRVGIHCLVMESFVGPKPAGLQVNHINGDKADNRLSNLEYVTASENRKHAFRIGLQRQPDQKGEKHYQAKLSEAAVREIRQMRANGAMYRDIG